VRIAANSTCKAVASWKTFPIGHAPQVERREGLGMKHSRAASDQTLTSGAERNCCVQLLLSQEPELARRACARSDVLVRCYSRERGLKLIFSAKQTGNGSCPATTRVVETAGASCRASAGDSSLGCSVEIRRAWLELPTLATCQLGWIRSLPRLHIRCGGYQHTETSRSRGLSKLALKPRDHDARRAFFRFGRFAS